MSAEAFDAIVRAACRPFHATIDDERVDQIRAHIKALAASEIPIETLVLAAHGRLSDDDADEIAAVLAAADSTYPTGRRAEACALAGLALLKPWVEAEVDDQPEPDPTLPAALMVISAEFAGLTPKVLELRTAAHGRVHAASGRARARLSDSDLTNLPRVRATNAPPPEETVEELAKKVTERDTKINQLIKRLEDVTRFYTRRLDLLDEEVDVLWWAQNRYSSSTGQLWVDMPPLTRATAAATEVSALVRRFPATAGTVRILASVVDSQESEHTVVDAIRACVSAGTPLTIESERLTPLTPLALGVLVLQESSTGTTPESLLQGEHGIDPLRTFSAREIAEQLMIERAIKELR